MMEGFGREELKWSWMVPMSVLICSLGFLLEIHALKQSETGDGPG
jgi:hypothetical protein